MWTHPHATYARMVDIPYKRTHICLKKNVGLWGILFPKLNWILWEIHWEYKILGITWSIIFVRINALVRVVKPLPRGTSMTCNYMYQTTRGRCQTELNLSTPCHHNWFPIVLGANDIFNTQYEMPKTKKITTSLVIDQLMHLSFWQTGKQCRQFKPRFQKMKDATLQDSDSSGVWFCSKASSSFRIAFPPRNRPTRGYCESTSHSISPHMRRYSCGPVSYSCWDSKSAIWTK